MAERSPKMHPVAKIGVLPKTLMTSVAARQQEAEAEAKAKQGGAAEIQAVQMQIQSLAQQMQVQMQAQQQMQAQMQVQIRSLANLHVEEQKEKQQMAAKGKHGAQEQASGVGRGKRQKHGPHTSSAGACPQQQLVQPQQQLPLQLFQQPQLQLYPLQQPQAPLQPVPQTPLQQATAFHGAFPPAGPYVAPSPMVSAFGTPVRPAAPAAQNVSPQGQPVPFPHMPGPNPFAGMVPVPFMMAPVTPPQQHKHPNA